MSNPFMPGNGIEPRYLAGREEFIESFERSLKSYEGGLPRNTVLSGLRGSGKTVLLRRFKVLSESRDWLAIEREFNDRFSDENSFAEAIVKDIVSGATEVSLAKKAKQVGKKIIDIIKPEELGAYGVTYKPFYKEKKHLLEDYLKEMLVKNWDAFKKSDKKGVVFLYDEFHTVKDSSQQKSYPLASLLGAISYAQRNGCKYYLCLGGLPTIMSNLKDAKTYTERMFELRQVGNLEADEAKKAITNTLKSSAYQFEDKLIDKIIEETGGYPYFIQFYGYFIIEQIGKKIITLKDFVGIRSKLIKDLDAGFFDDRVRLASPKERKILVAMARAGGVEIEVKQIIKISKISYGVLMELLKRLMEKGLVYRAERGRYGFTLPLFREFLLRLK
ncbi:MAG: AAA family ATPase [Rhabdochlamydiaceae bacterium]